MTRAEIVIFTLERTAVLMALPIAWQLLVAAYRKGCHYLRRVARKITDRRTRLGNEIATRGEGDRV